MIEEQSTKLSRRAFLEAGSAVLAVAGVPMAQAQQPNIQHPSEHPMKPATKGPLFVSFVAGPTGLWKVEHVNALVGESLPMAERLEVIESPTLQSSLFGGWALRGVTSNTRYSTQAEVHTMRSVQEGLGRPQAKRAALIPIRKSEAWWALAQDERRAIFEEQSHHIGMSVEYLPRIARRLHHSRELAEPFDFLTWFEYAPEHSDAFEDLVQKLRASKEWTYVDREVDIRLSRT
jgi:hypothetical protein